MKKKNVLITGASKGIGKSILKKFIKKKFRIIGTSRTYIGVKKIQKILKKNGFGMILKIDNYSEINFYLKKIINKIGNIDILINNIGMTQDNLITNISKKSWNSVINTNLTSIFYITKKIIKNMIKQKFGRIINIGSISGFIGNAGQIHYSSSKSALIGFTKSLSLEVAYKGITVNLISPGFIQTSMLKKLTILQLKKCLRKIPMKKFGHPKDIAYLVKFLSSKKASYITGQTIHVNGGICIL
ncbi:3-oxoacyl-ACP reductase FabG [Buchnera aphidicola]|uniref:3-oxoacyl-ACP reductase FabG n=1 Tax=Buchnera aphidicola TaxID=9 RepID=UPI0022375CB8|nr:3-oxoacyl-ACP reductase FabG [Buchnera aphidicola]MCW5197777.1 3-oxoacyl-ACP reductase FabG [Buchnera aphidicola (Chaitophorus viminalis)]